MNKKGYGLCVIMLLCVLSLVGCKKNKPKSECEQNGHTWVEATCTNAKTCSVCQVTEGSSLGHNWKEADCENPKTCDRCHTTEGEALGHTMVDATYNKGSYCSICQKVFSKDLIDQQLESLLPQETSSAITLPKQFETYDIKWASLDHDVLLDDGTLVYQDAAKEVTLTAEITIDGTTYKRDYQITVKASSVSKGTYDYAYNYYQTKVAKALNKNVTLITRDYNGCSVLYESLDSSILTSKGEITQGKRDQVVILNIYVIKDGIAIVYPTEVTVSAWSGLKRVDLAKTEVQQMVAAFAEGKESTLPLYCDTYETDLAWSANVPEFIVLDQVVLTPMEKTDVRLKCVIKYEGSSSTMEFDLKQVGGIIDEDTYLQALLDAYSKIELKGSINHLHKEYNDELYLDYQERINSYGVLNLFQATPLNVNKEYLIDEKRTDFVAKFFGSGTLGTVYKPTVPQSTLDSRFYEGYQMPNEDNVLWVVVHESAMTINGQNAAFLASMQYRYAFQDGGREASWNYQVDAYSIYQSFADNIICWHASDGTATRGTGNNNGIGIEMCVNQDGNYEGTLANNAKLVASLMLKYNLNMDNVKRHHDMDPKGKECPSYLIRTARYEEFLEMVRMEYLLQKYFGHSTVTYDLSTDTYTSTQSVLDNLFITGANGLYYNKEVKQPVDVQFQVKVERNGKTYQSTSIIHLLPEVTSES